MILSKLFLITKTHTWFISPKLV